MIRRQQSHSLLLRAILLLAVLPLTACRRAAFPDYPEGYREFAYVANSAGNTVTVLDLVYLRPDRSVQVGASPVALAANPLRAEVYALNARPGEPAGSVSIIDSGSNSVVATLPVGRAPSSIVVDPTGQRAFVSNSGSSSITILDLDGRRPLSTYPLGQRPGALALSPDGRTLAVTSDVAGSVSLYTAGIPPLPNKTTPAPRAESVPPLTLRAVFSGCPGAASPVILPDSSKAFIACSSSNQVFALSLAANTATSSGAWAARQDASTLADHALSLLEVGKNPTHLTLKPDGGEVFVSNTGSDSISEISTSTNEVGSTYAIGNAPTFGVVTPDNSALWISDSGSDSVSLYSIDDGKLLSSIRTGASPGPLVLSARAHLLLVADSRSGEVALIRTSSNLGPGLFTMLPTGGTPSALVVKSSSPRP